MQVKNQPSVSLDISKIYPEDQIQEMKLNVFKLAIKFYYSIQQRSKDKADL